MMLALLAVLLAMTQFTACSTGTAPAADKEEAYAEAIQVIKDNVDLANYKVYYMSLGTTNKMANNLEFVEIKMVSSKDLVFSQKIMLAGNKHAYPLEDVARTFEAPVYKDTKGIDLDKLDTKTIIGQIDAVKKLLPEGAKFKSVGFYTISESVPAGNTSFNVNKEFGDQTTTLGVAFEQPAPDGGDPLVYESKAMVMEDGTVKLI